MPADVGCDDPGTTDGGTNASGPRTRCFCASEAPRSRPWTSQSAQWSNFRSVRCEASEVIERLAVSLAESEDTHERPARDCTGARAAIRSLGLPAAALTAGS